VLSALAIFILPEVSTELPFLLVVTVARVVNGKTFTFATACVVIIVSFVALDYVAKFT
jgi:hypothetical protein